jgi:hypothetical protein
MMVALVAGVLILWVIVLPVVLLVRRMKHGDEMVRAGSWGRQFFGRTDESWGPKPTPSDDARHD